MTDHLSWKATPRQVLYFIFQCNCTCYQRPPVLKDHMCMAMGLSFRFHCTYIVNVKKHRAHHPRPPKKKSEKKSLDLRQSLIPVESSNFFSERFPSKSPNQLLYICKSNILHITFYDHDKIWNRYLSKIMFFCSFNSFNSFFCSFNSVNSVIINSEESDNYLKYPPPPSVQSITQHFFLQK